MSREAAQRYLSDVPSDRVFWCQDSQVFRGLGDLQAGLSHMSDETFSYHVNAEKNDFAYWVRDVIGDGTLANLLFRRHTRAEAVQALDRRLARLREAGGQDDMR